MPSVALYSVGATLAANPELADGVRHGVGRGGGGGFFLFPILLMILGGFLLFRLTGRGRRPYAGGHGAMVTLSDRFARGEISREEFEYRRAVLNNKKDIPPAPQFDQPYRGNPVEPDPATPEAGDQ